MAQKKTLMQKIMIVVLVIATMMFLIGPIARGLF